MAHPDDPNFLILRLAIRRLGALADRMVFLGGCATGLLLTDPAAPAPRPTRDVDAITEVLSLSAYYRLAEELRQAGFSEDQDEGAPVCRWRSEGLILDVMPTDPNILGFGNRWYGPALATAMTLDLQGDGIRVVAAPYFLATKLEAFAGRGGGDFLLSHDIEDCVALIDGRPELADEIRLAEASVRAYLAERFRSLLQTTGFLHALPGHLPPDAASQARLPLILARIRDIAHG